MKQSRPKISVENFGPIREGTVEFKPLTVFIGPNNSGKTYMATLMYALFKAFARNEFSTEWPHQFHSAFGDDYDEILRSWTTPPPLTVNDLPDGVREALEQIAHVLIFNGADGLHRSLLDAFGIGGINQLSSDANDDARIFALSVSGFDLAESVIKLRQEPQTTSAKRDCSPPQIGDLDISGVLGQSPFRARKKLLKSVWDEFLDRWGIPAGDAHYLPAGRSGMLRGWKLEEPTAERLANVQPGVSGDFLRVLLEKILRGTGNGSNKTLAATRADMDPALFLMENDLLAGGISVSGNFSRNTTMLYETDGLLSIPIPRASSMVAELAPLYLWIDRGVLRPGDVLIIDEPEAHLHPENQRLVARVLVRLVNAGVNVICATHSSMILHQMSNHILAAKKTAEKRAEVGFEDEDILNLDDLGAYLFNPSDGGARIEPVETDDTFGVSEDEFVRVADAVGDETYELVT